MNEYIKALLEGKACPPSNFLNKKSQQALKKYREIKNKHGIVDKNKKMY